MSALPGRHSIHKAQPIHTGPHGLGVPELSLPVHRTRDLAHRLLHAARGAARTDPGLVPPSMIGCRVRPIPGHDVEVGYHPPHAGSAARVEFGGLQTCGANACPCCAHSNAVRHAQDVNRLVTAHWGGEVAPTDGGGVYFLSLTLKHNLDHDLAYLAEVLRGALARYRNGRGAALRGEHRLWERAGVALRGFVLAHEETFSSHAGWHPHIHLLLFTDRYVEGSRGRELGRELRELEEWRQRARLAYLRSGPLAPVPADLAPLATYAAPRWVAERGIDPRWAPERAIAELLGSDPALCWSWELAQSWVSAVQAAAPDDPSVWPSLMGLDLATVVELRGVDCYLAKVGLELMGVGKSARGASRTPHQLLARAVGLDGAPLADRARARSEWLSWRGVYTGRRRVCWSGGRLDLRALYPGAEAPPLVAGLDAEPEPEVLGVVPGALWGYLARSEGWHADQRPAVAEAEARTLALWARAAAIQEGARLPLSAERALELAVEELAAERAEALVSEGWLWTPAVNLALSEVDPRVWGLRPLDGATLLRWSAERQGPELARAWLGWLSSMDATYNLSHPARERWARRSVSVLVRGLEASAPPPAVSWSVLL